MAAPRTPEEDAAIASYWGIDAPVRSAPDPAYTGPDPFAAGAVAAGIAPPQPPIGPPPASAPADPFGAGAARAGISPPPTERVYNDFDPSTVSGVHAISSPSSPAKPTSAKSSIPLGPTPEEDAALAAFNAKLTAPKKPAPVSTGASASSNPDPYGIKAAQSKMLGSFDSQMKATGRIGSAEADRAQAVSDQHAEMSRRMEEDAAIARAEEEYAAQHADAQISEIQRQIDDVRAKKIKPMSMMQASGQLGGMGIIGAAIGGFYQGLTHQENPFLAEMNRIIDRQMAADEKNLDNEKAGLSSRMNLLQQQRQVHHDTQIAKAAARNLYYEGFKEQLVAESQKYDVPIYKANADKAIADITMAQGQLQQQIGQAAMARAQAAAAQQYARAKEVQSVYRETYDKALSAGLAPAQAESEAQRMIGTLFAPGSVGPRPPSDGSDLALGKAGREEIAKETAKAHQEVQANLASIENARKNIGSITAGGSIGAVAAHAPAWAPGAETARKNANARESYNMGVRLAIGAGYRLRTGGMEPKNAEMIHELEEPFKILPSDNEQIATQKMDLLERYLRESGAAKGVEVPQAHRLNLKPVGR